MSGCVNRHTHAIYFDIQKSHTPSLGLWYSPPRVIHCLQINCGCCFLLSGVVRASSGRAAFIHPDNNTENSSGNPTNIRKNALPEGELHFSGAVRHRRL